MLELMLIEADARRYITEAIETERDLAAIEQKEKARGRIVFDTVEYTEKRSKLIQILGKINSVANPEGMGRDDLGNEILLAAEGIYRRISRLEWLEAPSCTWQGAWSPWTFTKFVDSIPYMCTAV